jgi:hypothetical protein
MSRSYLFFGGGGPMVMVRPQRWHRWTTVSPVLVACIATEQTGQTFGGFGRSGDCLMRYRATTRAILL